MTLPFIVVDQNQLREADIIASVLDRCCRENLQLLIPEGAGFEFSKGSDPFRTWILSLKPLAPCAEFVVVGKKITEIWRDEIEKGHACTDVIEHGATILFRRKLQQIAAGDESGVRSLIDGPVKQLMPESLAHWSKHGQIKSVIRTHYDSLKSSLTHATIKDLRNAPVDAMIAWLSSADGVRFVFQGIQSRGASSEAALRLAVGPSAIGGFISGMAAMSLYWLAFGGLEAAKPEAITNDLHDLEYAVLGALSNSMLSNDKRLKVIHQAITGGTDGRARWFARALDVGPARA